MEPVCMLYVSVCILFLSPAQAAQDDLRNIKNIVNRCITLYKGLACAACAGTPKKSI
jgi:hypothetical protein